MAPVLEVPGGNGVNVLDLHDIRKLLFPQTKRVAIIGGGFVGCELAGLSRTPNWLRCFQEEAPSFIPLATVLSPASSWRPSLRVFW
jgi:hypothetical protein